MGIDSETEQAVLGRFSLETPAAPRVEPKYRRRPPMKLLEPTWATRKLSQHFLSVSAEPLPFTTEGLHAPLERADPWIALSSFTATLNNPQRGAT